MFHRALLLAVLVAGVSAHARVFDYKNAHLAAYVRGTGGTSQLAQDQFANSNGGMSVDKKSSLQYGGELGVLLGLGPSIRWRLGAEVLQHSPVSHAGGTDAAGVSYYTLDSTTFIFNPCTTLEYTYSSMGNLRFYGAFGVGYAMVTGVNSYKMSAPGTAKWGVSDYDEKMEGSALSMIGEIGMETLFTDNSTFVFGVGYRHLPVRNLKYKGDVTTINGSVNKGDPVLNADGSKRTLNLGGVFASVAFRFYLNFL